MDTDSYLHRKRIRQQYSYTKSKAAIAFVLSLFFSIILTPFFENYGLAMLNQFTQAVNSILAEAEQDDPEPVNLDKIQAQKKPQKRSRNLDEVQSRLK